MIQNTTITEKALLSHLECPLRADGANSGPESPVLECAEGTSRWLLAEIAAGHQPTAVETREFFEIEWQQTNYFQARDSVPRKQYQRRLMEGVRACTRLRDLIWTHEILQPVSRYELTVDGIVITGEYAVLCSSRRKTHAFIPYLRYKGLKIRPVIPDIVTFARWLDASNRLPEHQWGDQPYRRHALLGKPEPGCRVPARSRVCCPSAARSGRHHFRTALPAGGRALPRLSHPQLQHRLPPGAPRMSYYTAAEVSYFSSSPGARAADGGHGPGNPPPGAGIGWPPTRAPPVRCRDEV